MRRAVYAGSFDPVTLGHVDIIQRGAAVFESLTVGVGVNPDKQPLFSTAERIALLETALADCENVDVRSFEGLAVEFARECDASILLRGVRTLTDIDTEFTMSLANRALASEIETVFLMAGEKFTHISSSLIKQIAHIGGESSREQLRAFVPEPVIKPLLDKFHA